MPQLKAQFVLGKDLSSWAISWFGGGGYSHVDLVMPDGGLLGARSDWIKGIHPGVMIRPPDYEKWKVKTVVAKEVSQLQFDQAIAIAKKQLFKPYDMTAIWGFATGRDWRNLDEWFCSELLMYVFETAKIVPEIPVKVEKIFPGEALAICAAAGFE
jgi:hypothetical protein